MRSLTLDQLAALCGGTVEGDGSLEIRGPASLDEAQSDQISFLAHPRYVERLESSSAGAVLVAEGVELGSGGPALVRCADPGRAFTAVVQAFAPEVVDPPAGVDPSAVVDPSATIDPTAAIGPGCTVAAGATVGADCVLEAQVHLGPHVQVGPGTRLCPGVVLQARTTVGARCTIHPGAVLGSDGFGFDPTPEGWVKVPQCGTVEVADDVEIGANAAIDRARFGATRIGHGTKIDNLVHVAHNVEVGAGSLLIAQCGIAGSSEIGPGVILAGQAGVPGHVRIASGVRLGAQAGAYGDLLEPGDYTGTPARPRTQTLRAMAAPKRVERLLDRVAELEARLDHLERERATEHESASEETA